jgi:hypothetical protein
LKPLPPKEEPRTSKPKRKRRLKALTPKVKSIESTDGTLEGLVGASAEKEAVKKEEDEESEEGAGGIEERIPGGGAAGGNKDLMNLIESRIDRCDEPGEESPGPLPGTAILARGTNAMVEEHEKNEILGEMGGFADDVVSEVECVLGDSRKQPADERLDNAGGVIGGEGVGGKDKDDGGPDEGRPPSVKPWANGGGVVDGAGGAPGFRWGHF